MHGTPEPSRKRRGETGSSPPVGTTGNVALETAVGTLRDRDLDIPVAGIERVDLRDSFSDSRGLGTRAHEALDIMAARNTPVRAVEDGTIVKLFYSMGGGGNRIYQYDPSLTFSYYYAHRDHYADGLREARPSGAGRRLVSWAAPATPRKTPRTFTSRSICSPPIANGGRGSQSIRIRSSGSRVARWLGS